MSFRRSARDEPGESRWRTKHRELLLRCGLPVEVVDSDRSLNYVLLHGADEFGTGWTHEWIDREQAVELLEFLSTEIPNPVGSELIRLLRKRVG